MIWDPSLWLAYGVFPQGKKLDFRKIRLSILAALKVYENRNWSQTQCHILLKCINQEKKKRELLVI